MQMTRTFPEYKTEDYLKDDIDMQVGYVNELLNIYIEGGNLEVFLQALKPLININFGNISAFAQKSGINRTYFYKLFKNQVKPEFSTVVKIIKALGFDINFNLTKVA
jgi:probable addiction module antidote protein